LRQATALRPKRNKASDGLLPSLAHQKQNPSSDHNTGFAADLTHDPANGIDCFDIYEKIQADKRVKYVIFHGKIWSAKNGETKYTGINQHNHHLHISIKETCGYDVSPWFPWMGKPNLTNKIKSNLTTLPKKVTK
jgi:LAS superfamily LD-carboxypeptidase LdcB